MKLREFPLVSVPVITYNSSKTVVDTLDSIYNQSYPKLELIVSDDCSTDNTVEICRNWIESHKDRFVRTELLTVEKNTGVSANMNRAESNCLGEWVKPIAGDDVMLSDCVETYVNYVRVHSEAVCVFAKMVPFGGEDWHRKALVDFYLSKQIFFEWPVDKQLDCLLKENCIPAPTSFFHRSTIKNLGIKNDERIPLIEDWPKWVNLLRRGIRFHFINKETVMYRISEGSISTSECQAEKFLKSKALFYIYYQFQEEFKKEKKHALKNYVYAKTVVKGTFFWKGINYIVKRVV